MKEYLYFIPGTNELTLYRERHRRIWMRVLSSETIVNNLGAATVPRFIYYIGCYIGEFD